MSLSARIGSHLGWSGADCVAESLFCFGFDGGGGCCCLGGASAGGSCALPTCTKTNSATLSKPIASLLAQDFLNQLICAIKFLHRFGHGSRVHRHRPIRGPVINIIAH